MTSSRPIQWFPGHMAQSMRLMQERLALVDVAIEVVDARLPAASANPLLDELIGATPRLLVLGREDLADPRLTGEWVAYERRRGRRAMAANAKHHGDLRRILTELEGLAGIGKTRRVMVIGIPNAGKSTVINSLAKRTAAKAEDRAGVTRALSWVRVSPTLELLDTPGILPPKIPTDDAQWQLALCGAIPRERYDAVEVVARFVAWAQARGRRAPDLEAFARERGLLRRGGEIDEHNAARVYVKEFNAARFGRLTFEAPPDDR